MKKCFKCGVEKEVDDFYKHPQMGDGHLGKCKECTKRDSTAHREANLERIRAYDRGRGNRLPTGYQAEYRRRFPNKYRAKGMVNNAVRDKRLHREDCSICGSRRHVHAHHDDYAKPLNVRWLCAAHHHQWHRDNGEGANG